MEVQRERISVYIFIYDAIYSLVKTYSKWIIFVV